MQINRADVADLIYFLAIARHRSFTRAAVEIGVSASALSHALKGLESRLGVRLLNRTTKSVTLTTAGETLAESIVHPFGAIDGALETLNRFRDTPSGRIRINAAVEAANLLLAPIIPAFMDRYPDVEIDIVASNRLIDVTDAGLMLVFGMAEPCRRTWLPGGYRPTFAGLLRHLLLTLSDTVHLSIRTTCSIIDASAIDWAMTGCIVGSSNEMEKLSRLPSQPRSLLTRPRRVSLLCWAVPG